jgi:flagellar FliL protein
MSEKPQAAENAPAEKKGGAPLLPIVGLVLVLNVLMVGKIFMGSGHGKEGGKTEKKVEEVGAKMPLEEFLVNLAGSNEHYLKMTVALGLKKGETEEKMKEEVAPIRDAILGILTTKQTEELATEAGKDKLKKELVEKINKELGGDKVVKVYFLSFATQ